MDGAGQANGDEVAGRASSGDRRWKKNEESPLAKVASPKPKGPCQD